MDAQAVILTLAACVLFFVWAVVVPYKYITKRSEKEETAGDAVGASAPAPVAQAEVAPAVAPSHEEEVPAVFRKDANWRAPLEPMVPRELIEFPRKANTARATASARVRKAPKAHWSGPLQAIHATASTKAIASATQRPASGARGMDRSPSLKNVKAPAATATPLVTTSGFQGPHPGQHDGFDPMPPWEEELAAFAANSMDERNPFAPI